MSSRLQITFRGLPPSEPIEARVRERVDKLDSLYDRISRCHVLIDTPHAHHHKGHLYEIHITIRVPQHDIVVSHASEANHAHEDAYVAVRDAFDAATRQLEDYVRRRRDTLKETAPHLGGILTPESAAKE